VADVRRFTEAKRERLLALLEAGWTLVDASAATPISRQTVAEWCARGRRQPESAAGEFAARFDALRAARAAQANGHGDEEDDLPPGHPLRWTTLDDPFLPLDPSLLAYLTDEQREEVRAIHADGDPRGEAVLDACLRWAEWARANLEAPYEIDWRALSNGRSPYPLSSPLPPSNDAAP